MTGKGRRPPEDCGGVWGYGDLREKLADPTHDEHADMLDWLGLETAAEFDAQAFDVDEVNAEVGNVLRRQVLAAELSPLDARSLLTDAATLVDLRHETSEAIRGAAWALRDNLSFYDALYVALAQALELSLLTADARLLTAPKLPCAVELVTSA